MLLLSYLFIHVCVCVVYVILHDYKCVSVLYTCTNRNDEAKVFSSCDSAADKTSCERAPRFHRAVALEVYYSEPVDFQGFPPVAFA